MIPFLRGEDHVPDVNPGNSADTVLLNPVPKFDTIKLTPFPPIFYWFAKRSQCK